MNITFDELRKIKHQLPTGSVSKIASELSIEEQTVRNYFGAKKFENGQVVGCHIEPGPHGGIVHLDSDQILRMAKKILAEAQSLAS
jgi:predicted transcriptional regulator